MSKFDKNTKNVKLSDMTKKQILVLEAAIAVFSRYGVRKATMGEIAQTAQISRQTLYAIYPSKEDIFANALRLMTERSFQDIHDEWERSTSLDEKLNAYFDHFIIAYFRHIQALPDADDLLTGIDEITANFVKEIEGQKAVLLEGLFEPYREQLLAFETTPENLADFFQTSSSNFKNAANDEPHLVRLLIPLKQSVLAMLGEANPA